MNYTKVIEYDINTLKELTGRMVHWHCGNCGNYIQVDVENQCFGCHTRLSDVIYSDKYYHFAEVGHLDYVALTVHPRVVDYLLLLALLKGEDVSDL